MDGMDEVQEWMAGILSERTKWHHKNAMKHFTEYMKMGPQDILDYRKREEHFETKVIMFYKWLQKEKKLSANSARSCVIGIQRFFSYHNVPLKLRHKLPKITMKLETYKPSLEDLQKLFRYGDLELKAWLNLSRDCPARISDLLEIAKDPKEEKLIRSQKESVVGKVYLTSETLELLQKAKLPSTQKGIDKMLQRGCEIAEIPKINQHLLRKVWISKALDLGLSEVLVKILSFKSVDPSMLTYYVDREELRTAWRKVINALPLETTNNNGRIGTLQEAMDMVLKVLRRMIIKELQNEGVSTEGLAVLRDYSKLTHKEILEENEELSEEATIEEAPEEIPSEEGAVTEAEAQSMGALEIYEKADDTQKMQILSSFAPQVVARLF